MNRYEYRNLIYTIQWQEHIAHYTIYIRSQIIRGIGNHGAAKAVIDRYVKITSN